MQFIEGKDECGIMLLRRFARRADKIGKIGFEFAAMGKPRLDVEVERYLKSLIRTARLHEPCKC